MSLFHDVAAPPADMLVTVADLVEWLKLDVATLSDQEVGNLETAIQFATAAIRAKVGRPIVLVNGDQVTLDGPGSEAFNLPSYPVVNIGSITENGVLVDAASYDWSRKIGRVERTDGSCWTRRLGGLVVVYTHGYDPVPTEIERVCMQKAARDLGSPDGRNITAEVLGAYSVTYESTRTMTAFTARSAGWTENEIQILGRYADGR